MNPQTLVSQHSRDTAHNTPRSPQARRETETAMEWPGRLALPLEAILTETARQWLLALCVIRGTA